MFKSANKSLAVLDEVCESPRLLGVDPIVRYFPPTSVVGHSSQQEDKSKPSTPYFNKNLSKMNVEYEDSDDDVCFGPITIKELRKASILMKTQRETRTFDADKSFLSALKDESAVPDSLLAPSKETPSAPPEEIIEEVSEEVQVVHDFSLEEAHFSGCNLSGLNLSFESGVNLPAATISPEPAKSSDGLYTLAFISDLAKKLEISDENEETEVAKPPSSPLSIADKSIYADADEEIACKDLEQSVTQWHDAEAKGLLDLERSAKKRISDVSLLSDETEVFDRSVDDKNDTHELLNDTIEEMERILAMEVDDLDKKDEENEETLEDKVTPAVNTDPNPIAEVLEEYSIPRAGSRANASKKFFPTPAAFYTPVTSKICSSDKSSSADSKKVDLASQVHKSTPFRVLKCTEARSADFKLKTGQTSQPKLPADFKPYRLQQPITSRLPKPVRAFKNITSPVGQYIHGPMIAPKIASAKPTNSPRVAGNCFSEGKVRVQSCKKSNLENASPLPYVDYDSASSIKVIEHKETKLKQMPNKIKKLLPSPGSVVLRHTGRVNIPETPDGRHEVSIMITQDAFQADI